jgi:hypothetical protein
MGVISSPFSRKDREERKTLAWIAYNFGCSCSILSGCPALLSSFGFQVTLIPSPPSFPSWLAADDDEEGGARDGWASNSRGEEERVRYEVRAVARRRMVLVPA